MAQELRMNEYKQAMDRYYSSEHVVRGLLTRPLEYLALRWEYRKERKAEKEKLKGMIDEIQQEFGLGKYAYNTVKEKDTEQSQGEVQGGDGASVIDTSYVAYNPYLHNTSSWVDAQRRKDLGIEEIMDVSRSEKSDSSKTSASYDNGSTNSESDSFYEKKDSDENGSSTVETSRDGTLEDKVDEGEGEEKQVTSNNTSQVSLENSLGERYYDIQKNGKLVRIGRDNDGFSYILLRKEDGDLHHEILLKGLDEEKLDEVKYLFKEGRANFVDIYDFVKTHNTSVVEVKNGVVVSDLEKHYEDFYRDDHARKLKDGMRFSALDYNYERIFEGKKQLEDIGCDEDNRLFLRTKGYEEDKIPYGATFLNLDEKTIQEIEDDIRDGTMSLERLRSIYAPSEFLIDGYESPFFYAYDGMVKKHGLDFANKVTRKSVEVMIQEAQQKDLVVGDVDLTDPKKAYHEFLSDIHEQWNDLSFLPVLDAIFKEHMEYYYASSLKG